MSNDYEKFFTCVNISLNLWIFMNMESFQSFKYSNTVNLWVSNEFENFLQLLILLWFMIFKNMESFQSFKYATVVNFMSVAWIRNFFITVNLVLNLWTLREHKVFKV